MACPFLSVYWTHPELQLPIGSKARSTRRPPFSSLYLCGLVDAARVVCAPTRHAPLLVPVQIRLATCWVSLVNTDHEQTDWRGPDFTIARIAPYMNKWPPKCKQHGRGTARLTGAERGGSKSGSFCSEKRRGEKDGEKSKISSSSTSPACSFV